ncbi:TPA: hypothetical protein DCX15_04955, partial [bacterium]|nr:hypothetical protein [bacterium]
MKYPYRAKTWLLLNGIPRFLSLVMVILLLTIGCGQKGKEMIEHVEPQKPKELEMENATTKEVDIETDILLAKEH